MIQLSTAILNHYYVFTNRRINTMHFPCFAHFLSLRYVLPTFEKFDKMDQPSHGKSFYLNPRDPKLERRKESFTVRVAFSSTKRTQVQSGGV
jgi:hypothetical protein